MPSKLKAYLRSELAERFKDESHGIFVDFTGLTAMEANALRGRLLKDALRLTVLRNRIAKLALQDAMDTDVAGLLTGPIAVIYGNDDPVSAAKVALSCVQELGKLEIRGGFLEGKVLAPEQIEDLSKMPSKAQLLASIAGSLKAPASNFLSYLEAIIRGLDFGGVARELAGLLDAHHHKLKESAG